MAQSHNDRMASKANAHKGINNNTPLSLDDIFMVYELDHRKDDFNSITLVLGNTNALQLADKLINKHPNTDKQMVKELGKIANDFSHGFIKFAELKEKNHDVFVKYGISFWDDPVRSWASPEEQISIGIAPLEYFLKNLPHKRLLDYALNLSEQVFLPTQPKQIN